MRGLRSARRERGSATIELVTVAPAVLLLLALVVLAGQIALARQSVTMAAFDAARSGSLSADASSAETAAHEAARTSLSQRGVECDPSIAVDASGFRLAPGVQGYVTVALSCRVALDAVALPGAPGMITLTAEARSPVDLYRSRPR
ncbi:MAG: pilus assembly protein [Propionibacteriaceae bacterium]|jgi:Flp pilus assembly protein TadG|nr:pilus assembly protein [Propionibacteriaceae bacterium]